MKNELKYLKCFLQRSCMNVYQAVHTQTQQHDEEQGGPQPRDGHCGEGFRVHDKDQTRTWTGTSTSTMKNVGTQLGSCSEPNPLITMAGLALCLHHKCDTDQLISCSLNFMLPEKRHSTSLLLVQTSGFFFLFFLLAPNSWSRPVKM